MPLLVDNILNSEVIKNEMSLLSGKDGLMRTIHSVSVMEVEDFPDENISEDLFILTTLSFCKDNIDKAELVFRKLIDKNIAGMAIKLNRFIEDVPKKIIKMADKHNTPLFVINNDIGFSTIIKEINFEMNKVYYENISKINSNYEHLYSAFRDGQDLSFFVEKLYELTNKPIYLVDNKLSIISSSEKPFDLDVLNIINNTSLNSLPINEITQASDSLYAFPFSGYKGVIGLIFIKSISNLNIYEETLLSQFSKFISMSLFDKDLTNIFIRKERNNIIRELISLENLNASEILTKLKSVKYAVSKNFQMIFVELDQNQHEDIYVSKLENSFLNILNTAEFIIEKIDNGYLIFCNIYENNHDVVTFPEMLKKSLQELSKKNQFYISYSPILDNLLDINKSYELLTKSMKLSKRLYEDNQIIDSTLFLEFVLTYDIKDSKFFTYIEKNVVEPINKLDKSKDGKYWITLKHCILSETIQAAAEKLYVHKTTVKYRLDKIKSITGLDYNNPLHKNKIVLAFMKHMSDVHIGD